MDIVGLLPKYKQGYQNILVVCDYATRYSEAFPLRNFTAPDVCSREVDKSYFLDMEFHGRY